MTSLLNKDLCRPIVGHSHYSRQQSCFNWKGHVLVKRLSSFVKPTLVAFTLSAIFGAEVVTPPTETLIDLTVSAVAAGHGLDARILSVQRLDNRHLRIQVAGAAGQEYLVEASTNLLDWIPLKLLSGSTNQTEFSDREAMGLQRRFYRVVPRSAANPIPADVAQAYASSPATPSDSGTSITLKSSSYTISEAGPALSIVVVRSGLKTNTVSVAYQTRNGTAMAGSDYAGTNGIVSFTPGITAKTLVIPIINDTLVEGAETFFVSLLAPQGAVLGASTNAILTILDNDQGGTIGFGATNYSVSETNSVARVTITRSAGSASGVTVDFSTASGTATAGLDYLNTTRTVTFDANETTKTIVIPILNDTAAEADEFFSLRLSNPAGGGKLGAASTATVRIVDDESSVSFTNATYAVSEAGPVLNVDVVRSGAKTAAASVDYETIDGAALSAQDYRPTRGTLTFPAGVGLKTISIVVTNDSVDETDESFGLKLANPQGGAQLGSIATTKVTIVDNDAGLLDGSQLYEGAIPPTADVSYTTKSGEAFVAYAAYVGFIQLFVQPGTPESTVSLTVSTNGGLIIEKIPKTGTYLVQVPPRQEASFLSKMNPQSWLIDAAPAGAFTTAGIVAFDLFRENPAFTNNICARYHGEHVANILQRSGAEVTRIDTFWDALLSLPSGNWYPRVGAHLVKEMAKRAGTGERTVFNLSLQPKVSGAASPLDRSTCNDAGCRQIRREQLLFFMSILQNIEATVNQSPAIANNSLVVIAAGNAGVDLGTELRGLAQQFPKAFKHVLIVGGTDAAGNVAKTLNHSDANLVYARGVAVQTGPDICTGTSFAAPEVSRVVDYIWSQNPNLTSEQMIDTFKQALASSGSGNRLPQDTNGLAATSFLQRAVALTGFALSLGTTGTGHGTISANPPGPNYPPGTVVKLTANPDACSSFVNWSGAASGTGPVTVVMSTNKSLTANFKKATYTLTVTKAGSGTVSMSPAGPTYDCGTVVTLTATAASGYKFDGWSGAASGTGQAVVTMNAAKAIVATFTKTPDAGVSKFDGAYGGNYSGTARAFGESFQVSGPVAFTVSNGILRVTVPGGGTGSVLSSGATSFQGAGSDADVAYTFKGTFSVSSGGKATASGTWTSTFDGGTASGSWNASR